MPAMLEPPGLIRGVGRRPDLGKNHTSGAQRDKPSTSKVGTRGGSPMGDEEAYYISDSPRNDVYPVTKDKQIRDGTHLFLVR